MSVTTIKLKKETKEKLDLIKKDRNISYDEIVCNLIRQTGGEYVEDTMNFTREKVAFKLKCYSTPNMETWVERDITYYDLKKSDVGTVFWACENPRTKDFVNSSSEIIYKDGDDVVVLNKHYHYDSDSKVDVVSLIAHYNIF